MERDFLASFERMNVAKENQEIIELAGWLIFGALGFFVIVVAHQLVFRKRRARDQVKGEEISVYK